MRRIYLFSKIKVFDVVQSKKLSYFLTFSHALEAFIHFSRRVTSIVYTLVEKANVFPHHLENVKGSFP